MNLWTGLIWELMEGEEKNMKERERSDWKLAKSEIRTKEKIEDETGTKWEREWNWNRFTGLEKISLRPE